MEFSEQYGPWALIPGGSEGLGASFAQKLAETGINLVLVARKQAALDVTAHAVREQTGVQVRTLALDLTQGDMLDQIRRVTDDVEVGMLIYNAGAAHGAEAFLDQPLERALSVLTLNPVGQFSLCHHFGQKMVARGKGGIVLIGSIAASAGTKGVVAYSAAKACTQFFAEGLWSELAPLGVDVVHFVIGRATTPANAQTYLNPGVTDAAAFPASCDDMALECLENLHNGPVVIPRHLDETFRRLAAMPRREAVEWIGDLMARLKQGVPAN